MDPDTRHGPETLKVASSLDRLEEVLAWFARLRHEHVPQQLWLQGETALVECFSNAVRHSQAAMADPPPVELEARIGTREFRMVISDHGPPFDLEAALIARRQLLASPEFDPLEHEEHWGLIFLLRLRDDHGWAITQQRTLDGRNRLLVTHALGGTG